MKKARSMLESGATWVATSRQLNVLEGSLRLWVKQFPDASDVIVPVAIEPATVPEGGGNLAVVTPEGIRVEGLDLDAAYQLVEMLRC